MFKQEKEIITQEKIKKTLKSMHRAAIPMMTVFFFGGVILMVLAAFILSELRDAAVYQVVIWGAILILDSLMTVFALVLLLRAIMISSASSKDLTVVEDLLLHMEEKNTRWLYGHRGAFGIFDSRHTVQLFHFQEHGTYFISGIDGSAYEYSSIDDKFYLVLTGRGKIALVYNQKVYEYKER